MKKVLIIKSIHEDGINLFKKNKNFEYEITDNTDEEYLKDKIKNFDAITVRTSKISKFFCRFQQTTRQHT